MPTKWKRIQELKETVTSVMYPPNTTWKSADVLIICDVIYAYKSLFNAECMHEIEKLIKSAKLNNIEIIFTKWSRTSKILNDAIDIKGHWSDYVPYDQTNFIFSDAGIHVVNVYHTNALRSPEIQELIKNKNRIILAGCWTESCIIHTARAASEQVNMLPSIVVKPATTGHFPISYFSLITLQMLYADVVQNIITPTQKF